LNNNNVEFAAQEFNIMENIKKLLTASNNNLLVQFLRYAIVGGIASILDVSLFLLSVNYLQIRHIPANTISFVSGLLVNYFLSRDWVFNQQKHNFKKDFISFSFIGIIGLLISNLMLYFLIDCRIIYVFLGYINTKALTFFSKLMTIIVVLFWNFTARRKFVFKSIN